MDAWIGHEAAIRYYVLIGSFGVIAVLEALLPHEGPAPAVRGRWAVNIGLTVLLSVLVALIFPLLSVGAAIAAAQGGIGLLNVVDLPAWAALVVTFLAIDASRYAMHVMLHRVPWLWRLHRVHHSDTAFDCTTALRFHPLEALVTLTLQLAVVIAIGAPPLAVLVFEIVAGFVALFSHGSVRVAAGLDSTLRKAVITPAMHRIHHSARREETDSNYGAVLPWWDWIFRTYRAAPSCPPAEMTIGLEQVRDARTEQIGWLLVSPFRQLPVAAS